MIDWLAGPVDEDNRFLSLPDPDSEPDPEYAEMCWSEIVEDLWGYEQYLRQAEEYWDGLRNRHHLY